METIQWQFFTKIFRLNRKRKKFLMLKANFQISKVKSNHIEQ